MALTLDELCRSPDHYLHSFAGDDALFVPMDRAAYRRSIFLDDRISPAGQGAMRVPVDALIPALRPAEPVDWIFHVAHCGSTLLARALDELAPNLVLREPLAMRQMAFGADDTGVGLVRMFLGRRYDPALPTLVKANVPVNFLIERIITAGTSDRALLLHFALEDYLLAILRNPNHRAWLRRVTGELAAYLGDLGELSDAECGAALWLAQTRRFAAALTASEAAMVLDAERFFAEPGVVLAAVTRHFGREAGKAEINALIAGPLFSTYSKNPGVAFANADRVSRRAGLTRELAPEIEQASDWIERTAPDLPDLLETLAARSL